MLTQWFLFVATGIVAYIGISLFGQLSGGSSQSATGAFLSALRPLPLLVMVIANMFFGLAIYFGLGVTRYAIPAAIALGVLTSFMYSTLFLGAEITLTKLAGAAVVVIGVVLMAL